MNESVDKHMNTRVKGSKVTREKKTSSGTVMNEWKQSKNNAGEMLIYYYSNH